VITVPLVIPAAYNSRWKISVSTGAAPCGTVEGCKMVMPQRDDTIEEIKRLDALLEYDVMHGDEAEVARLSAELTKLAEKV